LPTAKTVSSVAIDLTAWQKQTTAAFMVRMLPGDHFFLNSAQAILLAMLTQELNQFVPVVV